MIYVELKRMKYEVSDIKELCRPCIANQKGVCEIGHPGPMSGCAIIYSFLATGLDDDVRW